MGGDLSFCIVINNLLYIAIVFQKYRLVRLEMKETVSNEIEHESAHLAPWDDPRAQRARSRTHAIFFGASSALAVAAGVTGAWEIAAVSVCLGTYFGARFHCLRREAHKSKPEPT